MSPRAACRLESLGFAEVYDYAAGKVDWLAFGLPTEGRIAGAPRAATVARRDVPTATLEERMDEVRRRVGEAGADVCVVVGERGVVLGILRSEQLAGGDEVVAEAMRPGPSTFRPHVAIEEMADYMVKHHLPNAPITRSDGTLIGVLYREDALRVAAERQRRAEEEAERG